MKKYTNKILIITTALIFVASTVLFFFKVTEIKKKIAETTQVLVVGTIHEAHATNPNYSYQDIINILGTYNPDVICVEIPPSIFRKELYLKEMEIASIYGFDNNLKVYPIGCTLPDLQSEREAYMQTDEYLIKKEIADALEKSNDWFKHFIEKHGNIEDLYSENKMSYDFINGYDYNWYISEGYKISINVFGDGCMNDLYETRNNEMLKLIGNVITESKGKRMIVLTSAEHAHYFADTLSKRKDIGFLNFSRILPLKEISPTPNVAEYLENNSAKGYYSNNIKQ